MKYIGIKEYGPADNLVMEDGDIPTPGKGQVLIKVDAAGINRPDIFQRMGNYPPPPGASAIPGLEIAGEITRVADDVDRQLIGNKVCALVSGGGYAEYAVADAGLCLPIPPCLTVVEAAAIPETFFTVWSNVFDRGNLQQGESLLVHGGSSGIGTTAIQMAKALGARVFATAGDDDKCNACIDIGADTAINYRTQDFEEVCLSLTANAGVNVILDMVVGSYMQKNINLAAADGRIVIIAGLGGFKTEVNFQAVMRKRLTITGSTLRPRPVEFKAGIADSLRKHVWPLLETGKIKPLIHKTFPLNRAADAHKLMESSKHIGKIVLIMT